MRFEGSRVLMSGGSGGIGAQLLQRLVAAGALVTTLDRSGAPPEGVHRLHADLSSPDGIETAVSAVAGQEWDILINMAGAQYFGPFADQPPQSLYEGFAVNLMAPARLAQCVAPGMRARGRGQIVNIGSVFGSIAFAHFVAYSSAKAGLRGFSEALRRELAGSGVGVTHISPRAVRTALRNEQIARYAALVGLRLDTPEHVADRMLAAIRARRREVYIGFPESLFVRLNAMAPRLVDLCLQGSDRKAAGLFASPHASA